MHPSEIIMMDDKKKESERYERQMSLDIHDISIENYDDHNNCNDSYSNDFDISMNDDDDEDDELDTSSHEQLHDDIFLNPLVSLPPPQSRHNSFVKDPSSSSSSNNNRLRSLRTQESQMSLQSFTSMNSFSSHNNQGSNNNNNWLGEEILATATGGERRHHSLEIGDLVFCTDEEMAAMMMCDDSENKSVEDGMHLPHVTADSNHNHNNNDNNNSRIIMESLPPSSTLGTGAFSTVRLAWRRSESQEDSSEDERRGDALFVESSSSPPSSSSSFSYCFKQEKEGPTTTTRMEHNRILVPKKYLVAVKIIQKSILKQIKSIQRGPNNRITVHTAYDNIEREIATMKRLRHPNVVRLFEVIDNAESDRLYMVLEYVPLGEILTHVDGTDRYTRMRHRKMVHGLTSEGHFDEIHAALYFVDILHGLAYLHRNRICHRDLKPENILLGSNGIAKISDFGVAHIFEDEKLRDSRKFMLEDMSMRLLQSDCDDIDGSIHHLSQHESESAFNMSSKNDTGMLKKTEGTWCFWSPEMCSSSDEANAFSGYAVDLWAAGVCLYIFTTGRLPFFSINPSDLFLLIAKAEVRYEGLGLSDDLRDLLGRLLTKHPATRAGVGDCLKHSFCSNARSRRIHELGQKFKSSERQIVLSKNDVDAAVSVFKSQRHASLLGACAMVGNNNASDEGNVKRNDSKLTMVDNSIDARKEVLGRTQSRSALSNTGVRLGKRIRNIFNQIRNVES